MNTQRAPYYLLYRDNQAKWRWVYRAANHEPIGVSSESYNRRADCEHSINLMKASGASQVYVPEQDRAA